MRWQLLQRPEWLGLRQQPSSQCNTKELQLNKYYAPWHFHRHKCLLLSLLLLIADHSDTLYTSVREGDNNTKPDFFHRLKKYSTKNKEEKKKTNANMWNYQLSYWYLSWEADNCQISVSAEKSILCISTMKAASWHRTTDTEIMRYVSQTSGIPACQRFANINNQYQVP